MKIKEVDFILSAAAPALKQQARLLVDESLKGIPAMLENLVAEAVKNIPAPKDGQPGERGPGPDMAEIARIIKENVADIPAPKDGEPGKSVTIEDVKPVIQQAVKDEVATIPKPEVDMAEVERILSEKVSEIPPPKDGKSLTVEDVEPLILLTVKTAVEAIEKPKDGKDAVIDMGEVQKMIQKAVEEAVKGIQIPEPKNGLDGKDALEIEILPEIDEEKSYNRGTYATHKGGLWRSFERTKGMRGWENIVKGAADYRVEYDGEREFKIITELSNGDIEEKSFIAPVLIYKGVYKPDQEYEQGDTVTYGGSLHYCNENTTERPGTGSKSWTLAAKRGADGKDGKIKEEKKQPYKLHGGQ